MKLLQTRPWLGVKFVFPRLPLGVVVAICFHHARGVVLDDEPFYEAWSPPPEYASKTWGHKTMYLVDVAIGSAGQVFRMLVDTGSWMVVVPGAASHKLDCSKHPCLDVRNSTDNHQTAAVSFAHGSLSGQLFSDTVCAGSSAAHLREIGFLQKRVKKSHRRLHAQSSSLHQRSGDERRTKSGPSLCVEMPVLVADHESEDFVDAPFDGILGLGLRDTVASRRGEYRNPYSFLERLKAHGSTADAMFTLRLGNDGASELFFGMADTRNLAGGRLLWVPLSPAADGHWQLTVSDVMLNGRLQHIGAMEVIVDSGTSLLAPDEDLRERLVKALTPSDCGSVDSSPWLGFGLPGGGRLTMLPSDYIDRVDGKCILAVMPLNISSSSMTSAARDAIPRLILGDSFLRRYVTVFDMENRRIGFGVEQDSDLAKDVAAALFPNIPSDVLSGASRDETPAEDDFKSDSISEVGAESQRRNITHDVVSTSSTLPPDTKTNSSESGTIAAADEQADVNATMSAEEQAGFDYVRRLWESKGARNIKSERAAANQTEFLRKQARNSTEDKLEAASDSLDRMLGTLRAQKVLKANTSSSADIPANGTSPTDAEMPTESG